MLRRRLAARGYALAIHYHSSAVEATASVDTFRAAGVEAVAFQADLTNAHSVRGLIDKTLTHFGRLDVLVNCAAAWQRKKLEDVTEADVRFTSRRTR